jgi:hypothetical protein
MDNEYRGIIQHSKAMNYKDVHGIINADIFKAVDDKKSPWRLAVATCSGKYQYLQGKYFYFKKLADVHEWLALEILKILKTTKV